MVSRVLEAVDAACASAGRASSDVTVIAASKGFSGAALQAAWDRGIRHFGENYLQEAAGKRGDIPAEATWHFIGRLQSNKLRRIAEGFRWVHTIDRASQAHDLSRFAVEPLNVMLEVNIAREPQKGGVLPESVEELAEMVNAMPRLVFRGLMTMGPRNPNPESSRPYFIKMRQLMDGLRVPGVDCLSMGMSTDFEVAIQEGATHVRIGSAIFGDRPTKTE